MIQQLTSLKVDRLKRGERVYAPIPPPSTAPVSCPRPLKGGNERCICDFNILISLFVCSYFAHDPPSFPLKGRNDRYVSDFDILISLFLCSYFAHDPPHPCPPKGEKRSLCTRLQHSYFLVRLFLFRSRSTPFPPKGEKRALCKRLQNSYFLVHLFFNKKVRRESPCALWFKNR